MWGSILINNISIIEYSHESEGKKSLFKKCKTTAPQGSNWIDRHTVYCDHWLIGVGWPRGATALPSVWNVLTSTRLFRQDIFFPKSSFVCDLNLKQLEVWKVVVGICLNLSVWSEAVKELPLRFKCNGGWIIEGSSEVCEWIGAKRVWLRGSNEWGFGELMKSSSWLNFCQAPFNNCYTYNC